MAFVKKKESGFKEVLWNVVKKISEKVSVEFKSPEERTLIHGNWSETTTEKDSRKEYIQLIEFLGDILIQEFDTKTKDSYEEIREKIKGNLQEYNDKKITDEVYILNKLELMREMFRTLMILIKEKDYFGGFSLGYQPEDEDEDDDDDDDKD